jgi:flagellin FlaB
MKKNIWKSLKEKDVGAIGIGALIVFIAMVLVAGIAASVIISSSSTIQLQAMTTAHETTREVSSGVNVFDIEGKVNTTSNSSELPYTANTSTKGIKYLAIYVAPRPASDHIDLNNSYILISDGSSKALLRYNSSCFVTEYSGEVFSASNWDNADNSSFGVVVLQDYDGSITTFNPVINRGDKAILQVRCSNLDTGTFGTRLVERTEVFGRVIPEVGSPGVISFTTPMSYPDIIYDLQ